MLLTLCIKAKWTGICQDKKGFFFFSKSHSPKLQLSHFDALTGIQCVPPSLCSKVVRVLTEDCRKVLLTELKVSAAPWGFPTCSWGG